MCRICVTNDSHLLEMVGDQLFDFLERNNGGDGIGVIKSDGICLDAIKAAKMSISTAATITKTFANSINPNKGYVATHLRKKSVGDPTNHFTHPVYSMRGIDPFREENGAYITEGFKGSLYIHNGTVPKYEDYVRLIVASLLTTARTSPSKSARSTAVEELKIISENLKYMGDTYCAAWLVDIAEGHYILGSMLPDYGVFIELTPETPIVSKTSDRPLILLENPSYPDLYTLISTLNVPVYNKLVDLGYEVREVPNNEGMDIDYIRTHSRPVTDIEAIKLFEHKPTAQQLAIYYGDGWRETTSGVSSKVVTPSSHTTNTEYDSWEGDEALDYNLPFDFIRKPIKLLTN